MVAKHESSPSRSRTLFALALTVSLLSVSCGSERSPIPAIGNPTAADAASWVLASLDEQRTPTEAELTARFSSDALRVLPVASLRSTFLQLGQTLPPIRVIEQHEASPQKFDALLETAQGRLKLQIEMTLSEPRKIALLLFQPPLIAPTLSSFEDGLMLLQKAGRTAQLAVYELHEEGGCEPLFAHHPNELLAIGSSFKLWVLLALAEKSKVDPAFSWETQIAVRDELKSLPSGVLQDLPAGTMLSLREVATKMISISDNTATDHLIDFVGREAVERAQATSGHSAQQRNIPWPTTRELFALKLVATESERQGYRAADVPTKRAQLAALRTRALPALETLVWGPPRALDLEWFASADDLCGVLYALASSAQRDITAPALDVLAKNTGLPVERAPWTYIGFKGGSEPGVMNLSWLLQRKDGRWFALVLTVNDVDKAVDETTVLAAAGGLLRLLEKTF